MQLELSVFAMKFCEVYHTSLYENSDNEVW